MSAPEGTADAKPVLRCPWYWNEAVKRWAFSCSGKVCMSFLRSERCILCGRETIEVSPLLHMLPPCDYCMEAQAAPGAVLYGPPGSDGRCAKYHCCVKCYEELKPC